MKTSNIILIIIALAISISSIVAAIVFTFIKDADPDRGTRFSVADIDLEGEDSDLSVDQEIKLVVFFSSAKVTDRLVPVKRNIFNMISLSQQANQVIQQLIAGPSSSEYLKPTIPRGTRLLRLYLSETGTAYLVFSQEISTNHPGGASGELITIYSIVNTLCVNFPTIQAVQIVVENLSESTLAGHVDITNPLTLDSEYFALVSDSNAEESEDEDAEGQDEEYPVGEELGVE